MSPSLRAPLSAGLVLIAATVCIGPSSALAAGVQADFDGDGHDDLAASAATDRAGGVNRAGAVNVIYGGPAGLDASGDQRWHQDVPGIEDVAESSDGFGYALAAGDFDGDSFADLAVGVPSESSATVDGVGAVNVVYGSAGGLDASRDEFFLGPADASDEVLGGDSFGRDLAAGDFDNDGTSDLAVGIPNEEVGADSLAGAVGVIYGSGSGLSGGAQQVWHQDSPGIRNTAEGGDRFGLRLVAADFDDAAGSDLAVGVPIEGVRGKQAAGAVNLLLGAQSVGLTAVGNQFWHQDSSGVKDAAVRGELFGLGLGEGDFDGDGREDLAAGVFGERVAGKDGAGAVNVLYGSISGVGAADDQFWHQDSPGIADSVQQRDHLGEALAGGDFDNDGRADLAIDASGEKVAGQEAAGAVNAIYGSGTGLSAAGDQFWHQDSPGIGDSAGRVDQFGFALVAGRFDGNARDDLAVGVPYEDLGARSEAGAANVIYGSGAGLNSNGSQLWHQDRPGITGSASAGDYFGAGLPESPFVD